MPWAAIGKEASAIAGDYRQYDFQNRLNNSQEEFQKHMAQSGYQYSVADMKAAGINPMLAVMKGGATAQGGASGSAPAGNKGVDYVTAEVARAQIGHIQAQTRNVNSEADRNEQIAGILKAVGPRIVEGVGAIESSAGAVGTGIGQLNDIIRDALKDLPGSLRGGLDSLIQMLKDKLTPNVGRMPPAVLLDKAKAIVRERSMMPSPVKPHSAWGIGEYERAQRERYDRANESPASRRRSSRR